MNILLLALFSFISVAASGAAIKKEPQTNLSFNKSKSILKKLYKIHPETFYCGCEIKWKSAKKLVPISTNCGYKPRNEFTKKGKINKRAKRIEWEHMVPAWEFGHQLKCWQNGGRKSCKKNNAFKVMTSDLHNLVPAIGEVNADRSNYKFNIIPGEKRVYGHCDVEVNFKTKTFEPAPNVRGDIARTYFYFEQQHGLKISRKQRQLFTSWNTQDPVDSAECMIQSKKEQAQGNANSFIKSQCISYYN